MKTGWIALMVRLILPVALWLALFGTALASPDAEDPVPGAPGIEFKLGFKTLAQLIPGVVGLPLEAERYWANGDAVQATTGGLLVWRKADNVTAFTDGFTTWENGLRGLVKRVNPQPQEFSVGAPPPVGWKLAVMRRSNGNHYVTESEDRHDNNWLFFAVRGSAEIGTSDGSRVIKAGESTLIPPRQDHTHRYDLRTLILGWLLRPGNRPPGDPGDLHGGIPTFLPEQPLDVRPGSPYRWRVEEVALAPGERRPERTVAEPSFVYVIEGTLTSLTGDAVTATPRDDVFSMPLGARTVLGNEGTAPLRLLLMDLRLDLRQQG